MAEAKVLTANTGSVSQREVDLDRFGDQARRKLLRSAVLGYQANLRQGTHSTKTRGEVSRTGRKPWRQKGTGRARAGDFSSPLWRGGGTIFGPRPRDYRQKMSVKERREALKSALFTKFHDGQACFLDGVEWAAPSTKAAATALRSLGIDGGALVVVPERNETIYKSFRNLPRVDVVEARDVNAFQVLRRAHLVLVGGALEAIQQRLAAKGASAKAASKKESGDAQ